jgi:hypothetical protein
MGIPIPQRAAEYFSSGLLSHWLNLVSILQRTLFPPETICRPYCRGISISDEADTSPPSSVSSCAPGGDSTILQISHHTYQGTESAFTADSSYSVFLSSIAGVILTDYYFVRKGYFSLPDLYSADRDGPYWYWVGFNPKAYVFPSLSVNIRRPIFWAL